MLMTAKNALISLSFFLIFTFSGCAPENVWDYSASPMRPLKAKKVRFSQFSNEPFINSSEVSFPYDWLAPDQAPSKQELPVMIVFLHEGAFLTGDKSDFSSIKITRRFAELGYSVASLNYSTVIEGYARGESHKQTIGRAIEDVREAITHIQRTKNIPPERTFIVGYSAGAIIANHLVFSQPKQLAAYTKESDWGLKYPESSSRPFNTAFSIGGAVMDLSHVEAKDLDEIALVMIHGDDDQMVPFASGRAMKDKVNKDTRVEFPGIELELGFLGRFSKSLVIPAQTKNFIRNLLVDDTLCGPLCIEGEVAESDNFSMVTVKNGPHNLFIDGEKGHLTVTCGKIIRYVDSTIKRKIRALQREVSKLR